MSDDKSWVEQHIEASPENKRKFEAGAEALRRELEREMMSGLADARLNNLYFEKERKKAQANALLREYGNPTIAVTPFADKPETAENVERLRKFLSSPQFWEMLVEHWEV